MIIAKDKFCKDGTIKVELMMMESGFVGVILRYIDKNGFFLLEFSEHLVRLR